MIKAISYLPEGPLIFLGLSEGSIVKLKAGKPIIVELAELGLKGKVIIAYGKTEDALAEEIKNAGINITEEVDKRNPQ